MERSKKDLHSTVVSPLASQLYSLDPTDRQNMFYTLLEKIDSYDGDTQKPCLQALITTMGDVPEDEAFIRFNLFHERIARLDPSHHGEMFDVLASWLHELAESDAIICFNQILRASQSLSDSGKYWVLFRLAGQIVYLSGNDGIDSMAAVLRAGSELPKPFQDSLRRKLAHDIQYLPENRRLADNGVPETGIWDDDDYQNAILIPLAKEIPNLPEAEKRKRFEALKAVGEVLDDDRRQLLMRELDKYDPDRPTSRTAQQAGH